MIARSPDLVADSADRLVLEERVVARVQQGGTRKEICKDLGIKVHRLDRILWRANWRQKLAVKWPGLIGLPINVQYALAEELNAKTPEDVERIPVEALLSLHGFGTERLAVVNDWLVSRGLRPIGPKAEPPRCKACGQVVRARKPTAKGFENG